MGGRGAGSGMGGRFAAVKTFENSIRSLPVEYAAVYDASGNQLFWKTSGEADAVYFSTKESRQMSDGILTHNHPGGATFSEADIETSLSQGLREMRAVHSGGEYVLTRQFNIGDAVPERYMNFAKDYNSAVKSYMKNTVDAIYRATYDAERCNNMVAAYRNDWLAAHAKEYGWKYKGG